MCVCVCACMHVYLCECVCVCVRVRVGMHICVPVEMACMGLSHSAIDLSEITQCYHKCTTVII